ncbi:translin-associated factor TraX [Aspergillus eucalypticola CBS 122712]|uniref:Translin-associated factor TraX n=1 Tax=Aspergillus eucalypticola (strain CBS 122712 / IBT 29274) TaxID=1448314 RepID=A0A317VAP5_ASPEC|nr:translin-associated factor TraX [Aspergillus eucalypticola CBS 122712]PWY71424.1 translin-associated factor TraX [Aspergillus eucalypticola CBS 122712]
MADSTTDHSHQPEQQQQQQQQQQQPNPFIPMFTTFRDELDEHHDRRERIIKASRDITALSKKIIFALQRIRTLNHPLPPNLTKETTTRFAQITTHFTALLPDLTPAPNTHRYMRQLSPAIQEFIEAISFHHYLTTQSLITLEEVRKHLPAGILVTEEDYLLGLFDLTGEMMRFAVTGLSAGSTSEGDGVGLGEEQKGIVVDLREMRCGFEGLSVPGRHRGVMLRDMGKKVDVMQGSVEKVERAAYGILVRGRERPKGWRPDLVVSGGGEDEY